MNINIAGRIRGIERRHIETAIILKVCVSAGLAAAYFLPPVHAIAIGITTNLLWLWKL